MAPYQGIILAVVGLTAAYLGYNVLTSTNAFSNDDQHRSLRITSSMTATLKEQQLDTTNERRARELWTIDPRSVAPRVSNPYVEPNAAQLRNSAFDIRTADFNSAMNVPPLRPIQEEQLLQGSSLLAGEGMVPRVHIYIKTSGKHPYIDHAMNIADTYGRDIDKITFMFDTNNVEEVDAEFSLSSLTGAAPGEGLEGGAKRPWARVVHVAGTDAQGGYKSCEGECNEVLYKAYAAQRIKTRAVFIDFFERITASAISMGDATIAAVTAITMKAAEDMRDIDWETLRRAGAPDWLCYLDDDMYVNVRNLKLDLVLKQPSCYPNCLITDKQLHSHIEYTQGGWCMSLPLAQSTALLLNSKTDEELGWTSTDDVSFNKYVLQRWLNVSPTDSERWWSELSWRKKSPKRQATRPLHNDDLVKFHENIVDSLAVYHMRYMA